MMWTKGVEIMSKKTMWITTGIYIFCAVIWTVNFFLHWHQDGGINTSTALFGMAAAFFGIAAVLNIIRICRMKKEGK